jgi:antibiotic biosynthesis monooxygenase (ABM) superfamily enzyme
MEVNPLEVSLCVLLWAHEGREAELSAYEDQVLGLLPEHDGHVIQRARTVAGNGDSDEPAEVQFLRFASEAALDGYLNDARREALADQRKAVVAMTEVMRIQLV